MRSNSSLFSDTHLAQITHPTTGMTLEPHNLTLTRRFLQAKHPARDFLCVRRGAEGIMGSSC